MIKKVFAILLIMSLLIVMSISVFCHEGSNDWHKGHFVQKDGVTVAYHYHSGINAGWELIFNKYIKWDDRGKITLPLKINDSTLGTWKKITKDYKIKWLPYDSKTDPKGITWTKTVKLDNNDMQMNKDYNSKNTEITITITGTKYLNGKKPIVYEGITKQKLNETGFTDVVVVAKNKPIFGQLNQSESYKFTFKFYSSNAFNFNGSYVALQEPSPSTSASVSPSPSPSIIPSSETSVESIKPDSNNNKTLPKTGENSSVVMIFGFGILIIGVLVSIGYKVLGKNN